MKQFIIQDSLLNRLRYYSLLSIPFTIFIVLLLSIIFNISLLSSLIIIILLFTCTTLFLYLKEYLDYKFMGYPLWLLRLWFSFSEKERANLSFNLHDSVLQEHLQLLREIEKIIDESIDQSIKNKLNDFKEKILDNIHLIRETCNELRPPILSELGIIQSIQNLIEQTKLRCDFILKSELDQSIKKLDREYELTLYRVVQELLNNAMKHSNASEVIISLCKKDQTLSLIYSDNGKGIDITKLNPSIERMGFFGIKERVKSIGGTFEINSSSGNGMRVFIQIKTGGSEND